MAQAWLYAGRSAEFWKLVTHVLNAASPTLNYPEAIHPQTGGGAMGDGHHGWASAEIAMALRNALVYEVWNSGNAAADLVLLAGIPTEWMASGNRLWANRLPVPGGLMSLELVTTSQGSILDISYQRQEGAGMGKWTVNLPGTADCITVNGSPVSAWKGENGRRFVEIPSVPGKSRISWVEKDFRNQTAGA
jgi:hypothetical protein